MLRRMLSELSSFTNRWWTVEMSGGQANAWGARLLPPPTRSLGRGRQESRLHGRCLSESTGGGKGAADQGEVQWQSYPSLLELRRSWTALDIEEGACGLTVVLILDDSFCGDLVALIRRHHPALRLVLVAPAGRLPGLASIGDLAASSGALGWHSIARERDWQAAVEGVVASMEPDDRAVVFYPKWPGLRSQLRGIAKAK